MKIVSLGVLVLLAGMLGSSFTVYEAERGLKIHLGKLTVEPSGAIQIIKPGLHFKWPIIEQVRIFDARARLLSIAADRIPTLEKKDVTVDLFVKWRIQDFGLFYRRALNNTASRPEVSRAEAYLIQSTTNVLRATFGERTIAALVADGRHEVMRHLQAGVARSAEKLGIEVLDVRIKRLDLPSTLSEAVHNRMRTERKTEATEILAHGDAEAELIRAQAERARQVTLAEAHKQADVMRGLADAKAAAIYAQSYSRAPQFYQFYRSMEAYKNTFDERQDTLVLTPNSEYFKYFKSNPNLKE